MPQISGEAADTYFQRRSIEFGAANMERLDVFAYVRWLQFVQAPSQQVNKDLRDHAIEFMQAFITQTLTHSDPIVRSFGAHRNAGSILEALRDLQTKAEVDDTALEQYTKVVELIENGRLDVCANAVRIGNRGFTRRRLTESEKKNWFMGCKIAIHSATDSITAGRSVISFVVSKLKNSPASSGGSIIAGLLEWMPSFIDQLAETNANTDELESQLSKT